MAAGFAVAVMDNDWQTDELKKAFAKGLLFDPSDPYRVAKMVAPGNPGRALYMVDFWVADPVVIEEQKALIELHGELYFLPNKAAIARKVFEESQTAKTSSERQAALRLYSTLMGFMVEGNTINNKNTIVNAGGDNKVMYVTTHGTDKEWEATAAKQQAGLVEAAQADIARDEAALQLAQGDDGIWDHDAVKRA